MPTLYRLKACCPECQCSMYRIEGSAPLCLNCGFISAALVAECAKRGLTVRESLEPSRFYHEPVEGRGG